MANKIQWKLIVDTKSGVASLHRLDKAQDKLTRSMGQTGKAGKRMGSTMGGVRRGVRGLHVAIIAIAGALGLKMLAKSFLKAADTAEQFSIRLEVLLGSASEGNKLFKDMARFASQVPFEYENIMNSAARLATVLKGGREEIGDWMPVAADIAAAFGLPIEVTADQMARMFTGMVGSARLFRIKGVTQMLGFQDGVDRSIDEIKAKMMAMWKDPESRFRGATDKLAKAWTGLISMMKDKWFMFRVLVMDSGPFEALKRTLGATDKAIAEAFKSGEAEKFADKVGLAFVRMFEVISLAFAGTYDFIAPKIREISDAVEKMKEIYEKFPSPVKAAAKEITKPPTSTMDVIKRAVPGLYAIEQGKKLIGGKFGGEKELPSIVTEEDLLLKRKYAVLDEWEEAKLQELQRPSEMKEALLLKKKYAPLEEWEEAELEKLEKAEVSETLTDKVRKLFKGVYEEIEKIKDEEAEEAADEAKVAEVVRVPIGIELAPELRPMKTLVKEISAYYRERERIRLELEKAEAVAYGTESDVRKKQQEIDILSIRDKYSTEIELMEKHGMSMIEINDYVKAKIKETNDKYRDEDLEAERITAGAKRSILQSQLGEWASLFQQMSSSKMKGMRSAFVAYKAFAIAETTIAAHQAFTEALKNDPTIVGQIHAASILGQALIKVALISSQAVPSYDEGGISRKPGVYYSGVPEAHIPLKGGSVPVVFRDQNKERVSEIFREQNRMYDEGGISREPGVYYAGKPEAHIPLQRGNVPVVFQGGAERKAIFIMNNPVFQDLETQRNAMEIIAEKMVVQGSSKAVYDDYYNDGEMRRLIRGR